MSQPQPGADRPAEGAEERAVAEPTPPAPKPVDAEGSGQPVDATPQPVDGEGSGQPVDATPQPVDGEGSDVPVDATAPAETGDARPEPPDARPETATATPGETGATPPGPAGTPAPETADEPSDADDTPPVPAVRARGSAAVSGRATPVPNPARVGHTPDPTRVEDAPHSARAEDAPDRMKIEHGPDRTKIEHAPDRTKVEGGPNPPNPTRVDDAPRWSGSAAVPPPPSRRRSWGESAEPTPVPPAGSPEHATPVDPWAGVDTTGWDLHSVELPALPPTMPYTAPWPAHPASPPAARPVSPPAQTPPYPTPPPARTPPYPAPPAARPVSPPYPGPPASRPVSPPPKQARPPKQRRGRPAPPAAPPLGWQAPKGYVPVPVRRRRRWPWVLLLSVACCCGVPLWWIQPLSSQYPASATLPDQLDSMRLRQDQGSQSTAEDLKSGIRQADWLAEDTFAGIYGTDDGKRVTLFGSTGFRFTPESDAEAELKRLTDDYALQPSVTVDTGVRGRYERCAVGRADGDAVVVCTSVDHGSLATGVFTRLSVDDSGRLLNDLRQQVVVPKQS
ncbi:hypothetical protein ACIA5A_14355 [Micromonospora sp. NPDC051300]|uniref:hypothetical protein n=1 Tax=Micromonospora sp. NPDC051300 TaxID=3364286 RepID=UPI0037BA8ED8